MITNLRLINFRNHQDFTIPSESKMIVISGDNGMGKTNILEAISLLAPGRSMRSCKFEDIISQSQNYMNAWAVHATINGSVFSTGYSLGSVRKIKKDQEALRSQSEILDEVKILWLLPQMENIFAGASTCRRKFLDRMCYNLFPEHAKNVIRYEFYLKSRMKLLQQNYLDDYWLKSIEENLGILTKIIHQTRFKAVSIISDEIFSINSKFLKPIIRLKQDIDNQDDLFLADCFKKNRVLDKRSRKSNFGAHKEDLIVINPLKNQRAELCSTGEQKSILIAILIAQAKAIKSVCKLAPVMLMDEILAHLDLHKQKDILLELYDLLSQIWITTTRKQKDLYEINNNFLFLDLNNIK